MSEGCVSRFLVKSVLLFGAVSYLGVPRVAITVCHGSAWIDPGAAAEHPRTAGANAQPGVGCCLENMRWPEPLCTEGLPRRSRLTKKT